jgi:hypothetical protein
MTSFLFTNGGFHKAETRWIEQILHDTDVQARSNLFAVFKGHFLARNSSKDIVAPFLISSLLT